MVETGLEAGIDPGKLWFVILALGAGSFGFRFVFLGLVGDRALPDWLLRHLRYTAVSVLPALVVPLIIWPQATDGETDPLRLTAAVAAFIAGYWFKSVLGAMGAGAFILALGALYL